MQTFHHKLWRVEWIIQWPWARSINAILIENFSSLSLIFRFRLITSDKIRTCEPKIRRPIFVGKPARTSWFKFGFLLGILIKRIVSGNDQQHINRYDYFLSRLSIITIKDKTIFEPGNCPTGPLPSWLNQSRIRSWQ